MWARWNTEKVVERKGENVLHTEVRSRAQRISCNKSIKEHLFPLKVAMKSSLRFAVIISKYVWR